MELRVLEIGHRQIPFYGWLEIPPACRNLESGVVEGNMGPSPNTQFEKTERDSPVKLSPT